MDPKTRYSKCPSDPSPKLAETTISSSGTTQSEGRADAIPLVSPEKAVAVFSSQRLMSWEEKKLQIDRSLGRRSDSA